MQPQRPMIITISCTIGFVVFGLSTLTIPSMYGMITAAYGDWYGPVWLLFLGLTLASLIGYWRMKRWGVFLYVGAFIVGTAAGILLGLPFTIPGVIVPALISALGLAYLRRMG
jgi:hypothetical protein